MSASPDSSTGSHNQTDSKIQASVFKPAQRKQRPFKIAITGPSGSGKTTAALVLGTTLGKRVAVIDTENGSASLYSDRFQFDVLELKPPFEPKKFTEAIKAAEEAGFEVIVIDSFSHVWAGEGGLLDKKQSLDSRGGSSFTNWAGITKEQEALNSKILHSPLSLIVTMRSKQEYILQENEKGKQVPKKVGMAPVQRADSEYDYDVVFDLGMDHQFTVSKDRTGLFDGRIEKISDQHAGELLKWKEGGQVLITAKPEPIAQKVEATPLPLVTQTAPPPQLPKDPLPAALKKTTSHMRVSEAQGRMVYARMAGMGWQKIAINDFLKRWGVERTEQILAEHLNEVLAELKAYEERYKAEAPNIQF